MSHPLTNSNTAPLCPTSVTTGPVENELRHSMVYIIDHAHEDYQQAAAGIDSDEVQVKQFRTASAALRIPRYEAPLFYIVNVDLPDMSGFDLREMLADFWPRVPGYLISDTYNPRDEIRARCSGATLYFCKPLASDWLASAIKPNFRNHSPSPAASVTLPQERRL